MLADFLTDERDFEMVKRIAESTDTFGRRLLREVLFLQKLIEADPDVRRDAVRAALLEEIRVIRDKTEMLEWTIGQLGNTICGQRKLIDDLLGEQPCPAPSQPS